MKKQIKDENLITPPTASITTFTNLDSVPLQDLTSYSAEVANLIPVGHFVRAKAVNQYLMTTYHLDKIAANRKAWSALLSNKRQFRKVPDYRGLFQRIA